MYNIFIFVKSLKPGEYRLYFHYLGTASQGLRGASPKQVVEKLEAKRNSKRKKKPEEHAKSPFVKGGFRGISGFYKITPNPPFAKGGIRAAPNLGQNLLCSSLVAN
jgi:hypothetical protein